jgi:hypothetical protein
MAQTLTASRTAYRNAYPSSSASVSTEMHTWHSQNHAHTANAPNGVSSSRTKPALSLPSTNGVHRAVHRKTDFYKNGRPAEVIVIDSESPEPLAQTSMKRKRQNSVSTSTTVSAGTKRVRKTLVDDAPSQHTTEPMHKPYSVVYYQDERGVHRAKDVIVPKIEDVRSPLLRYLRRGSGFRLHASDDIC